MLHTLRLVYSTNNKKQKKILVTRGSHIHKERLFILSMIIPRILKSTLQNVLTFKILLSVYVTIISTDDVCHIIESSIAWHYFICILVYIFEPTLGLFLMWLLCQVIVSGSQAAMAFFMFLSWAEATLAWSVLLPFWIRGFVAQRFQNHHGYLDLRVNSKKAVDYFSYRHVSHCLCKCRCRVVVKYSAWTNGREWLSSKIWACGTNMSLLM